MVTTKAHVKIPNYEIEKNRKKIAEGKRAQSEVAKAHSLRNRQNTRKKTHDIKNQTPSASNITFLFEFFIYACILICI